MAEPESEPESQYVTAYYMVSGPAATDSYALAQRMHRSATNTQAEYWLACLLGEQWSFLYAKRVRMTGLWRASTGACFVSTNDGTILHCPVPLSQPGAYTAIVERELTDGVLDGIFGLHDDCVFTFGHRYGQHESRVFRWNGSDWSELPPIPFRAHEMHGIGESNLWAVGERGCIAQFDGATWHEYPCPTAETLTAVYAVSDEEVYAVGFNGSVLEGSVHGWGRVGRSEELRAGEHEALFDIVKWDDDVWIAGGYAGLLRRVPREHRLERVKHSFYPQDFDIRGGRLVIAANRAIIETRDGEDFVGFGVDALSEARGERALYDW